MSEDWADRIAERLLSRGLLQTGICLVLGGVDTGKTTIAAAIAGRFAPSGPVGVIDADIGQSHIGPPATVGWVFVDKPQVDFSQLIPDGISFVGDITPVGHLLQLTAAITQCVRQASKVAGKIIIDTPGFIAGPAASALWWTVHRILQPKLILAVQREDELSDVLAGMQNLGSQLELVQCPSWMPVKTSQARSSYRQSIFIKYFQDSCLYNIDLTEMTIQSNLNPGRESLTSRLVALRDKDGTDLAIGIVDDLRNNGETVVVRAPQLDISRVSCLVIGDVTVDLTGQ
jgi:polynucleotide 5'-hydroxyl-kinase GRC3/NOL9